MKKFKMGTMLILIVGLLLIQNTISFANNPIKLLINGKYIQCDVQPQIINGRVMIPARYVAEELGATVSWDQINQTVIINRKKNTPSTSTNTNKIDINADKQEFLALKTKADAIIADSYNMVMNNEYNKSAYNRCLEAKSDFMKWGNITPDYSTAKSYYEKVLSDIGILNVDNEFLSQYPGHDEYISERSKYKGELLRDKSMLDAEISRLQKLGKL